MSWTFKPVINTGFSFSGDMVYNSSEIEVPDSVIKYINSVDNDIQSMYLDKYTGFETVKYQVRDSSLRHFSINFVGNMPRWVRDLLCELAIAVNGAGMVIQFRDTWVTGTDAVPVVYYCNWLNAGDFVDSNVLPNLQEFFLQKMFWLHLYFCHYFFRQVVSNICHHKLHLRFV